MYFLLAIVGGDLRLAELLQTDRSGEPNGGGALEILVLRRRSLLRRLSSRARLSTTS